MRREIFLLHSQPSVSAEGAPLPEASESELEGGEKQIG